MTALNSLSFDEFDEILVSAEDRFNRRLVALKKLVDKESVYLFGYGGKGRTLAWQIAAGSGTKVIVYDSSRVARELAATEGFQTVDDLLDVGKAECGVILGACQAQMEQASLITSNSIYYQEAAYLFDAPHLSSKAREFSTWIVENKKSLFDIYGSIHDLSRESFVSVLSFRLSLDPHDLLRCRRKNCDMWFDVPETYSERTYSTFLDVGAYDGDTLLLARKRLSVSRGIAVEANKCLFGSIEQVAKAYHDGVLIVPQAAWSHRCRLRFSEVRGGMISVSEADDGELEAGPIDDNIHEDVDLMKMDIEGSEISALTGCLRTLKTGPDLAIAAYHRPDDLVRLPMFLESAGYRKPAFDFHLAHYSDCFDDTIVYFLRKRSPS
jgi:FkbM family methyltransferase